MNNVQLCGRLVKDPMIKYTDGGNSIARFTVACDRQFKKDGQPSADFIPCVAFGKSAETIEKFFKKGKPILLRGRIQTGSYEKDGQTVYTTDVIVDSFEFVPSDKTAKADNDGFMEIPEDAAEEMPFK